MIESQEKQKFSFTDKRITRKEQEEQEKSEEERADERHYKIIMTLLWMIIASISLSVCLGSSPETSHHIDYLLKISKTLLFEIFLLDIVKRLSKNISSMEFKSKSRTIYIYMLWSFAFLVTTLLAFSLV